MGVIYKRKRLFFLNAKVKGDWIFYNCTLPFEFKKGFLKLYWGCNEVGDLGLAIKINREREYYLYGKIDYASAIAIFPIGNFNGNKLKVKLKRIGGSVGDAIMWGLSVSKF